MDQYRAKVQGGSVQSQESKMDKNKMDQYKAKAWTLLGTFFWKAAVNKSPIEMVEQCELMDEYNDTEQCFLNARRLAPNDSKILNRYARFLRNNKRYEDALEVLDESVKIDQSSENWFAFSSRGSIYINIYFALPSRRGAERLLGKAKVSFEKALDMHTNLDDEINLAQVLQKLGYSRDAIELFQSVVDRLDGQKCVMVHNKMGYCLMQGTFSSRRAIEAFKRAMECESSTFLKPTNFQHMLRMLLQLCKDQSNPKHLIEEVRFWLEEAHAKYSEISQIVKVSCENYGLQMLEVCENMQAKGRHQLASQYLSCLQSVSSSGKCEEINRLLGAINIGGENVASSDSEISARAHNIVPCLSYTRNIKGKKNDCFIWHSAEGRDAEWVYYSLLPRLEDCHRYKCCVPLRDIQSASSVMELPSNVDEAACVIVILTSTFCRDAICQELVNTLVSDSVYTVLPVTLDDNFIPASLRSPKVIPYYSWELLLKALEKACIP